MASLDLDDDQIPVLVLREQVDDPLPELFLSVDGLQTLFDEGKILPQLVGDFFLAPEQRKVILSLDVEGLDKINGMESDVHGFLGLALPCDYHQMAFFQRAVHARADHVIDGVQFLVLVDGERAVPLDHQHPISARKLARSPAPVLDVTRTHDNQQFAAADRPLNQ